MNNIQPLTVIAGDEALTEFRQGLTGPYALDLLKEAGGRLLVQLPVGVGKTEWLVKIIEHATVAKEHDLIVVLEPRWDILTEVLERLPADLPRTVLRPRPRKRCGDLDAAWIELEETGCGSFGRASLCPGCPRRRGCPWPKQYSSLKQVRLVLATQQHLVNNPQFIRQLCQQTKATRPLVLLDESDLLIRAGERILRKSDVEKFLEVLENVKKDEPKLAKVIEKWLYIVGLVAIAPNIDLQDGSWKFPWVNNYWATKVQEAGKAHSDGFRFIGYDLHYFANSDRVGRERLPSGDIRYAVPPYLGREFIVFSGSIAKHLARYRLDPNHRYPALVSPFEHYRFEHPGTRWYNISTLGGAAKFFPGNSKTILDFFAIKIARNIEQGKRTLLVAKKKFLGLCQVGLRDRLKQLGVGPVKIVTGNWKDHDLEDPRVLPLINYGISGVNIFQHCEAAYCLTGFYVSAYVVSRTVHDLDATEDRFPITLHHVGDPPIRKATVTMPNNPGTIIPSIAQGVLDQKEADVVLQAVGRVRPFTRPREVITFQAGALPGVRYTLQFRGLGQLRAFFGIKTAISATVDDRAAQARKMKAQGYTKTQIAAEMGISRSTVKRYIHR